MRAVVLRAVGQIRGDAVAEPGANQPVDAGERCPQEPQDAAVPWRAPPGAPETAPRALQVVRVRRPPVELSGPVSGRR